MKGCLILGGILFGVIFLLCGWLSNPDPVGIQQFRVLSFGGFAFLGCVAFIWYVFKADNKNKVVWGVGYLLLVCFLVIDWLNTYNPLVWVWGLRLTNSSRLTEFIFMNGLWLGPLVFIVLVGLIILQVQQTEDRLQAAAQAPKKLTLGEKLPTNLSPRQARAVLHDPKRVKRYEAKGYVGHLGPWEHIEKEKESAILHTKYTKAKDGADWEEWEVFVDGHLKEHVGSREGAEKTMLGFITGENWRY